MAERPLGAPSISLKHVDGVAVVALSGEHDLTTVDELRAALEELMAAHADRGSTLRTRRSSTLSSRGASARRVPRLTAEDRGNAVDEVHRIRGH